MTIYKSLAVTVEPVGDRQVRVICSTADEDRAGDIVVQEGGDLSAYRSNPVVLWAHDTSIPAIAKSIEIDVVGGKIQSLVDFGPEGIDPLAEKILAKVKARIINAVSIGFTPKETEPLDPSNPKKGPQRYVKWELGEFSFVNVPANAGALTVERTNSASTAAWKVGASRNLPVLATKALPREAAAKSILDQAEFEGDHPNTAFARKGFLVYDAADAESDGSYRIPFAEVVDGRLSVSKAGLGEARKLLEKSDLPDDVATKARAVIEHYEAKMADKSVPVQVTRVGAPLNAKDLYDVASVAYALNNLGYLQRNSAWEAEMEGDGSQVPAMIAEACRALADALVAMTAEEVAELLAGMTPEGEAAVAKGLCTKDAKPFVKAYAGATVKAGAKFSKATKDAITKACENIKSGHDTLSGLLGDASDSDDDDETKTAPTSDTDKSAEVLRQKRLRDLDLLSVSAA